MSRQILIVDDNAMNRQLLIRILYQNYDILEAADGKEALSLMSENHQTLSAVLLDVMMPEMDGYEVLRRARDNIKLFKLPIIVITGSTDEESRLKALSLGANDFIVKPSDPEIIRHCLRNNIALRETEATVSALQRDELTGLLNRKAFCGKAVEMIRAHEPGYYVMSCIDIDNFKVVNDQYGIETGDKVLKYAANCIKSFLDENEGICCRAAADNFYTLYPSACMDSEGIHANHRDMTSPECLNSTIVVRIGRYIVNEPELSINAMIDRALLAKRMIKGKYGQYISQYDDSMRESILTEQHIVADMAEALKQRQFEAWFQPQYNHTTGALIGAEALVRWRHPQKGLIPPYQFIPVFEKNGFVYELDKYVWEEVCRYLRCWIDEGLAPLPVSVNISRYDIFQPDMVEVLVGLIDKYVLPVELLRLEITESSFSQSTKQIVDIVTRLIDIGFTVEIDDFGSGYSSLNTLKSVPAQIVKLDMRFLEDDNGSGRGGNILESIVRMTKWLGMAVIAEGVEDKAQADFLESIGCNYVQGYLYARPMTAADYKVLGATVNKAERLISIETVENMDNNAFWDPKSIDTLIFSSYVGAACIFEYCEGKIELLRSNSKFAAILGDGTMSVEDTLKLDWISCLTPESLRRVREVLKRSSESGEEITEEYIFTNIPGTSSETYLLATMRVIATAGKRQLIYCTCENITAQRMAERNERQTAKELRAVMDNVNCGITAVKFEGDEIRYLMINDRYYEMLGYSKKQYHGAELLEPIHPEDRAGVMAVSRRVNETGIPATIEFRAVRMDGSTIWLRCSMTMTDFEGAGERKVQLAIFTDVTSEKMAAQELLDNLPGGASLYEYDGKKLSAIHMNKRYWEMVDRAPVEYSELQAFTAIYPEDRSLVSQEIESAIRQERDAMCDIRVRYGKDGYRAFHIVGRIVPQTPKEAGKYSIYASYTPISDETMSIQRMLPIALEAFMAANTQFSFVKDKDLKYICCSKAVAKLVGLEDEKEIAGKSDYDIFERSLAQEYIETDRRIIESGESVTEHVEIIPSDDGKPHYSMTSKFPLKDSKGNIIGLYGSGRDITEYRTMESRLELLNNSIPGGIAVYEGYSGDPEGIRLSYFSDGFCRLFGYEREEYEKRAWMNPIDLLQKDDIPVMLAQIRALVSENTPIDCVCRANMKDGSDKWINIKAVLGEKQGDKLSVNAVLFDVTAQREALEKLRVSEEENRLAMQLSGNIVCRYNVAERTLRASPEAAEKLGHPALIEDVPYGPVRLNRIAPESVEAYVGLFEDIMHGSGSGSTVFRSRSADGWQWLDAHYLTIFSSSGEPVSAVMSLNDATARVEKEAAYKKWQHSMQSKSPESYSLYRCNISKNISYESEEGSLLDVKFKAGTSTFDELAAEYCGRCVFEEDRKAFIAFLNSDAMLAGYYRGKRSETLDYREKIKEGGYRWLRLSADLFEYPNSTDIEAYLLFENIDEDKRTQLQTKALAETDQLTGLLNRATFAERVNRAVKAAKPNTCHALLMLDIDGFKQVNDVFGHATGDKTLMDTADAMHSAVRSDDPIGRLGGDEFVVFLGNLPNDSIAENKAKQICALIRRSFSLEVQISASIGIAVAPFDGTDFEALYKKADSALYYVKGSGKDNYAFYHDYMEDRNNAPESEEHKAASKEEKKKKRRMLIIDDNRLDCELLAGIFEDEYHIEKATDGNSALISLRHYGSSIAVVLLDLIMPGMDGFAVLRKMQCNTELQSIPVVVVSGDEQPDTCLRAIMSGAADFVTKPIDPEMLRIRVRTAVSKSENEKLRARCHFQELQSSEAVRYKTVLDRTGTFVIEYDWVKSTFTYDPAVSEHIAGKYDERKLWYILLSDMVADAQTVQKMQTLVHSLAEDRTRFEDKIEVRLKTPSGGKHTFLMKVYKLANDFGLTDKLILAFNDTGGESSAEK